MHDGIQKNSLVHENPTTCRVLKLVSAFVNVNGRDRVLNTNNPRYAQAEKGLNYTHLSYKLIQTYIQTSHDESKEIEQVSYSLTDDNGSTFTR